MTTADSTLEPTVTRVETLTLAYKVDQPVTSSYHTRPVRADRVTVTYERRNGGEWERPDARWSGWYGSDGKRAGWGIYGDGDEFAHVLADAAERIQNL